MSAFTPEQEGAIRSLLGLWGPDRLVLVGGAAMAALTGMPWRVTLDIDLVLLAELPETVRRLSSLAEWARDSAHEQRWRYGGRVIVDLIPVTPEILRAGAMRWPRSNLLMSTAGMELAHRVTQPLTLSDGTSLHVARLPVIVLLKMVSFMDRPHERARDLADVAWAFTSYVEELGERRFDPRFAELGVEYLEASAFMLGEDLRAIAADHRGLVERFLQTVEGDWLDAMADRGPTDWGRRRSEAQRHLHAFRRGFTGRGEA